MSGVIKNLGKEFSLRDIRVDLKMTMERDFLDDLIEDVLLSLGCVRLRRSYDARTRWYLRPVLDDEDDCYRALKSFLASQEEPFTLDDVFEQLFPYQKIDRRLRTIITKSLTQLGCQGFESPGNTTSKFWYRPPVSMEEARN